MEDSMNNQQTQTITWRIIRRLLIFGFVSILVAIAGWLAVVNLAFPSFSQSIGGRTWELFDVFSGLISLSLFAGGFIFVLAEYIDTEKAKQAEKAKLSYEIYNAIFDKLTDPEQEAARRWILLNIHVKKDNEDRATWYENTNKRIMFCEEGKSGLPEGQNAIKMTLNCLDYIGFIAKHYWEVEKDSLDWISAPIAKIWRRIGPYVEHVRELRKTSDYYLSAEDVGKMCIQYRTSKHMQDEEIAQQTP
jgi:hypothetical protein